MTENRTSFFVTQQFNMSYHFVTPSSDGRLAMSEILNVIQNASPALAAAIIGLLYAVRGQKKEIEELKKRVDDYDALKISASLARIQTDLEWIKRKLEDE